MTLPFTESTALAEPGLTSGVLRPMRYSATEAASVFESPGWSPLFLSVRELYAIGLMGFGSESHSFRNPSLNLLPAYQSSGPFSVIASCRVFPVAGLFILWHSPHFLEMNTASPSALGKAANDCEVKTKTAATTIKAKKFFKEHLRGQSNPLKYLVLFQMKG